MHPAVKKYVNVIQQQLLYNIKVSTHTNVQELNPSKSEDTKKQNLSFYLALVLLKLEFAW